MEIKKIVISFKDSSLKEFHIHKEIDLEIKSTHQIWLEIDLRVKPSSDLQVFNQVFFGRCYQDSITKFKNLFPQSTAPIIFDLGAYTGISTLYLKSLFPSSSIYSIEPERNNYMLLRSNIKNNNLTNVFHLEAAVWNKNTQVSLDEKFRDGKEWSSIFKEDQAGSTSALNMTTLLSSRNISQIDFLKIDIEGAEQMLLGELECANQFLPKTKFIAIELHPEYLSREKTKVIFDHFNFEFVFRNDVSYGWNKSLL